MIMGHRTLRGVVMVAAALALLAGIARPEEKDRTYRDTDLGFSIRVPAALHLMTDAARLDALFGGAAPSPAPSGAPTSVSGARFILSVKPFGSPGLNPNLLLLTRSTQRLPTMSAEEIAGRTLDDLVARVPGLTVLEPVHPVTLAGRTFYTATVSVPHPAGGTVRQQHYIYTSFARQTAWFFTVTRAADASGRDVFDEVLGSLRLEFPDDAASPSPVASPAPASSPMPDAPRCPSR